MLFAILNIALLLGVIIVPLRPRKNKKKGGPLVKTEKRLPELSTYVIKENGSLDQIREVSLSSDR